MQNATTYYGFCVKLKCEEKIAPGSENEILIRYLEIWDLNILYLPVVWEAQFVVIISVSLLQMKALIIERPFAGRFFDTFFEFFW